MAPDCWTEWLLRRRFAGDPDVERRVLEDLRPVRDRVLDGARLAPGEALLDVGCGDGLIAFGAIERGAGQVVFSDISDDLLEECRRIATEAGVLDRCAFLHAGADRLDGVGDGSVDVVTTRSVLIYVARKREAFEEFHRVLRPGGRVSLFEPINRLNRFLRAHEATAVQELDDRVKGVFDRLQPRDEDPMLDFDDRDLVELAERAGFERVSLTLEMTTEPPAPAAWNEFVDTAWNPRIPTMREVMDEVLSPAERETYEAHMRPQVEQGVGSRRMAVAYLVAVKGG
ncbi:MAG TPA: class I SAM-dependent methyltransferase [Gaiellales bacterium]